MTEERLGKKNSFLKFIAVSFAACLVFAIMQGVHDNYGIMMKALVNTSGLSYQDISLIIGIGAFLYGLIQAFWGAVALRYSNGTVMLIGAFLMALGLIATPFCHSFFTMLIFFGIILPSGTGALGSGIIMGAITPVIGEKRAAGIVGILQASAGIGDAIMSPSLQALISWKSINFGMGSFGVLTVIIIPVIIWISILSRKENKKKEESAEEKLTFITVFKEGFKDPLYRRIVIGFSTCGFNMSIIESHLFSQYVSWGIPESKSSFIMTIYGILTMIGALLTGFLCTKMKKNIVLGSVYFTRVLISIAMLTLKPSLGFAIIATGLLGMSGDSTVPPTMGLITGRFGAKRLAVLYGIALTGHQIGAFFSSWFGGYCYTNFGNYNLLWMVNILLALTASIASWSIKEKSQA